jgi:hypothetical protein
MTVRYLYDTGGWYAAFVEHQHLFTPECEWLGVARGEQVYNTAGEYVGVLCADDRLARDRSPHLPRRILRPITPRRPVRPIPPKRHLYFPELPPPLEDTFLGLRRPLTALFPVPRLEAFGRLSGCSLTADDGTFLGTVSRDPLAPDSLGDPLGPSGSTDSEQSVFNTRGPYGSRESPLSPFHPASSTPPRLERDGECVALLSVNPALPDRVDPNELLAWLTMR